MAAASRGKTSDPNVCYAPAMVRKRKAGCPAGEHDWESFPIPNDARRRCLRCGAIGYVRRRQAHRKGAKVLLYRCHERGCRGLVRHIDRPGGGFQEVFSCDEHRPKG